MPYVFFRCIGVSCCGSFRSFRSFSVESVGYGSVSDGSDCEDAELLDDDHDPHLAQLRAPAEDTSVFNAQLLDDLAF